MSKYFLALLIFLALFVGARLVSQVAEAEAKLTWLAPVDRVDGTPLPLSEILGYEIECSAKGIVTVPSTGPVLTHTIVYNRLTESGEQSCVARTLATGDAPGDVLISANSNTKTFVVDPVVVQPREPGQLDVTVTNI